MNARTQRHLRRITFETKRRAVPWSLIIASAICIGVAVGCGLVALG